MGIAYNSSIVRDGLVLHLDAANPKSYPGTGSTWKDLSGYGNDATLVNGTSISGGVATFDGVDDYINCGTATIFSPPYLTASIFVNCNSFSKRQHLFGRGSGTSGNFYIVAETNAVLRFYNDIGANWSISTSTSAFSLDTWVQVTCTHDGLVSKIYYNGIMQSSGSRVGILRDWQSNALQISGINNSSLPIDGITSCAQLYDRALSEPEIKQNFNAIRGRYGL